MELFDEKITFELKISSHHILMVAISFSMFLLVKGGGEG